MYVLQKWMNIKTVGTVISLVNIPLKYEKEEKRRKNADKHMVRPVGQTYVPYASILDQSLG